MKRKNVLCLSWGPFHNVVTYLLQSEPVGKKNNYLRGRTLTGRYDYVAAH